jgi:hypothetical protein
VSSDRLAGSILDSFGSVRCALTEAAVWSVRVVMLDVLDEELLEVSLVPDEGPVAEFAADGADPSFGVGVRDRRVRRRADDRGALAAEHVIKADEELAGAVADHEPDRTVGAHHEVPGGLSGPGAGRILRGATQACARRATGAVMGRSPLVILVDCSVPLAPGVEALHGMGVVVNDRSAVGRLAQRLVVGLTRVGVGVRGARELSVRDKETSVPIRVLVFPVTVDGVEYLVSTRPDVRWVKSLRKLRSGELCLGRTRRDVRVTPVTDDADATRIVGAYRQHVPSMLSREPATMVRPVVFRIDPA